MRPRSQDGFSLIEVLAAFAVLATGLGVLIAILAGGMRQVRWSADHSEAVEVARSVIDTLGVMQPLQPGVIEGGSEDGHYRWRIEVEPWEDPTVGGGDPFAEPVSLIDTVLLYRLDLDLVWGHGGPREQLQVSTLRPVRPEPEMIP